MTEELHGGPCDGQEVELHPLSNYWEVRICQDGLAHIYRRQMPDMTFRPNPLLYAGTEKIAVERS